MSAPSDWWLAHAIPDSQVDDMIWMIWYEMDFSICCIISWVFSCGSLKDQGVHPCKGYRRTSGFAGIALRLISDHMFDAVRKLFVSEPGPQMFGNSANPSKSSWEGQTWSLLDITKVASSTRLVCSVRSHLGEGKAWPQWNEADMIKST